MINREMLTAPGISGRGGSCFADLPVSSSFVSRGSTPENRSATTCQLIYGFQGACFLNGEAKSNFARASFLIAEVRNNLAGASFMIA
jgi:hypothetical protein